MQSLKNEIRGSPMSPLSRDTLYKIYDIHRAYVEHEDNLINYRTTWLIAIQSFVIATFGFCFQKEYEIITNIILDESAIDKVRIVNDKLFDFSMLLLFLAVVGIVTAILTMLSVHAATHAILSVESNWN